MNKLHSKRRKFQCPVAISERYALGTSSDAFYGTSKLKDIATYFFLVCLIEDKFPPGRKSSKQLDAIIFHDIYCSIYPLPESLLKMYFTFKI